MHLDCETDRQTASLLASGPACSPPLPFAHLNLRRNPFGELELSLWSELAVVDVDHLVPRLREPGYAVQFMGKKGRGKTTHILALLRHFPEARYVHVGENERPRMPQSQPLFVDEIQRVPRRRRRRLFRRRVSLVIGTHEDFRKELADAGFEVETVRVAGALDPRRLVEILNRRIEAARRAPGPLPRITEPTARAMINRFGDDLRAIQGAMYDVFQTLPGIQDVEM
jgi:hypothetical protein